MNPTSIPDEEIWDGAIRYVAMPPDGDITGEGGIEPVEMLKGIIADTEMPFQAVRFTATQEEAQRLMNGEPLWLVYFFPYPVPVALNFLNEMISDEPAGEPSNGEG